MGFERKASWLHPSSLLFGVIGSIRQFVVALVFMLIGKGVGDFSSMWIAGVLVCAAVIRVFLKYLTFRYSLTDEVLLIDEGLIFRRHRTIPANRIQNVELIRNPLHHLFGVAEVLIETAGGSEPEARLRVLGMADVARLRDAIFRLRDSKHVLAPESNGSFEAPIPLGPSYLQDDLAGEAAQSDGSLHPAPYVYRIPLTRLMLAGLLSNRGFLLIPITLGLAQQLRLDEHMDVEKVRRLVPDQITGAEEALWGAVAILLLLVVLRLSSMVWCVLRFYGYELVRQGDDLRVKSGLITQRSATIPRNRIQFISIQQTMLERLFGLASVRIETAGGAGPNQGKGNSAIAGRWFLPVAHDSEIPRIMKELREDWGQPNQHFALGKLLWHPTHPQTYARLVRAAVVLGVGLGVIVAAVWGVRAGGGAGLVAVVLFSTLARWKAKSLSYAREASAVYFRSGIFTRKLSITFFDKIQNVEMLQGWFDRRWNMAALVVDTAAAGPAQHRVKPRYLPEEFALSEYGQIASRIDQTPPAYRDPRNFRGPYDSRSSVGIMRGDCSLLEPANDSEFNGLESQ